MAQHVSLSAESSSVTSVPAPQKHSSNQTGGVKSKTANRNKCDFCGEKFMTEKSFKNHLVICKKKRTTFFKNSTIVIKKIHSPV